MGKVDKLVEAEAVHEVVGEHGAVGPFGLTHHLRRARVIQEQVVHQARPPRRHSVRAPEPHLSNQRVPAPIEVARIVVRTKSVLLSKEC